MNIGFPDVNVLLALAWPNHQFHDLARAWYGTAEGSGWATCAVTQLGFIRLSSNRAFSEHAKTPGEATQMLADLVSRPSHQFIARLPAPGDDCFSQIAQKLQGHRQVTDAYLVAVALAHDLTLVTFDQRIQHLSPNPKTVRTLPVT